MTGMWELLRTAAIDDSWTLILVIVGISVIARIAYTKNHK